MNQSSQPVRVALVAFACHPGKGSEYGAGWRWAWAAAEDHEVWLITDAINREAIESEQVRRPLATLHPVYVPQTRLIPVHAMSGRMIRLRYLLWLCGAARALRRLKMDRGVRFDLGHHVTFSNDWLPAPFWRSNEPPFIWGPVGGAPPLSMAALRWMGIRGAMTEVVRGIGTELGRQTAGRFTAARARLVLAQNSVVGARIRGTQRPVVVEPNVAIDPAELDLGRTAVAAAGSTELGGRRKAVFAGRLLAWKGAALAIATLANPSAADWDLSVYGEGYDLGRLRKLAARHGVADRVLFHGERPRAEVLADLAKADALLFPSLADAAGWIVAEAMMLGCPVVCVDRGGPPELLRAGNGVVVALRGDVAGQLALALTQIERRGMPDRRWASGRLPGLIRDLYADALADHRASA